MRVLVLCKRQYTGRDLLDDRYGRLFELPAGLAARGHEVAGLACAYRPRGASLRREAGVRWWSVDAWPSPLAWWRQCDAIRAAVRPQVIWASSDAIHAVTAVGLGRRWGIPVVVDLYDDYESFGLTKLPGLRRMFRRACARADAISVVSHTLEGIVRRRMSDAPPIEVINNGVPAGFGNDMPTREEARRRLGLPQELRLVGTAGALDASRGIVDLLHAHALLRKRRADVCLVVAGPRDEATGHALGEGVIDLGTLPHEHIPWLYSALDVGVCCNRDSAFGRACYPLKVVEMLACGLPVVATSVGDVAMLLQECPGCLYPAGDVNALMYRLEAQLNAPVTVPKRVALPWLVLAEQLEALLHAATGSRG